MQNVNPVGALAGAWFAIMNDIHHEVVGRIFVFGLDLWRQQLAKVDASGGEHDNCQFVAKIVGSTILNYYLSVVKRTSKFPSHII